MMRTVGIYVFDDVEVLDFSGPFEVFSVANRVAIRGGAEPPFNVVTVARSGPKITARGGYIFQPSHTFETCPAIDVLLVPGGVVDAEYENPRVIEWITSTHEQSSLTTSVCTGAFLLAKAGILDDRSATTHWEDLDDLEQRHPEITVVRDTLWVDEGDVVTSAGISAGIEMSLHLVRRLVDEDVAELTARQMEYNWRDDSR
ncbi:MAG: DJ-1/PfpI family protein [Rhodospirillales bacterium]|nr:DJ-1/PfpI family protein [Rhodospirillales bacterium]